MQPKFIPVPTDMFEYAGVSKTSRSMILFKCLLPGCNEKMLACSINSRRNLKRHIKVNSLFKCRVPCVKF